MITEFKFLDALILDVLKFIGTFSSYLASISIAFKYRYHNGGSPKSFFYVNYIDSKVLWYVYTITMY